MPIFHRPDWKFLVTLLATLAGIIVPVWLWQSDLASKSLAVHVLSRSNLNPKSVAPLADLQVVLNGHTLANPTIFELKINNAGTKPIIASDFESPLELKIAAPARLITASLGAVCPPDLQPKIQVAPPSVIVQPLLLNPKDCFQITVIVDGHAPELSTFARIAGVTTVPIVDSLAEKDIRKTRLRAIASVFLLYIYSYAALVILDASRRRDRTLQFWAVISAVLAGAVAISFLENIGKNFVASIIEIAPRMMVGLMLTIFTRFLLRRRARGV